MKNILPVYCYFNIKPNVLNVKNIDYSVSFIKTFCSLDVWLKLF